MHIGIVLYCTYYIIIPTVTHSIISSSMKFVIKKPRYLKLFTFPIFPRVSGSEINIFYVLLTTSKINFPKTYFKTFVLLCLILCMFLPNLWYSLQLLHHLSKPNISSFYNNYTILIIRYILKHTEATTRQSRIYRRLPI